MCEPSCLPLTICRYGASNPQSLQGSGGNVTAGTMTDQKRLTMIRVRTDEDLRATVALFYEYAKSIGIDLSFQDFDTEMASMPGKYSPPTGDLLLARNSSGEPVGCAAMRRLGLEGVCEIKRLYVAPAGRGTGVGKTLAKAVIQTATNLGYSEMRLDTLPTMTAAIGLYQSLGFVDIPAYYSTPVEGTRFLSLDLRSNPRGPPSSFIWKSNASAPIS